MTDQGRHCEGLDRRHAPPEDRLHDKQSRADLPSLVIIIHSLAQAIVALRAALKADVGRSSLDQRRRARRAVMSAQAGSGRSSPRRAKRFPTPACSILLDCGDDVGAALAAIRAEIKGVVFTGRADVARRACRYRLANTACDS